MYKKLHKNPPDDSMLLLYCGWMNMMAVFAVALEK